MATWVLASSNAGKLAELRAILVKNEASIELRCLADFVVSHGPSPEVNESADTFLGNANIKALAYHQWCGEAVLADDSGLAIDALGGAPGVRSARYADPPSDAANLAKVLHAMRGIENRSAAFHCVLSLAADGKIMRNYVGTLRGSIAAAARGSGGFGYDSIFIPDGESRTLAELSHEEKNKMSHRAVALACLCEDLRQGTIGT